MKHPYIIIGQGIAGSMLAWFLLQEGQDVLVVDEFKVNSASQIASGVSNPITGRRFVKTWLADELLSFAANTYRSLEDFFSERFFHPLPIFKLLHAVKEQNDWAARCGDAEYKRFLQNKNLVHLDDARIKNQFGTFQIDGGSRLTVMKFLLLMRKHFRSKGILHEENFSAASGLTTSESTRIIFCEGANAINNPYFRYLPFELAKGECLLLRIPNFFSEQIINSEVMLVPTEEEDIYYAGATHEWYFDNEQPSEWGHSRLLSEIDKLLNCSYEIVAHKAAVRPTVKDRRPFIGMHPQHPQLGILNGMGTKGISLAPFFAQHFAQHLVHGTPLMDEVNIARFSSSVNIHILAT